MNNEIGVSPRDVEVAPFWISDTVRLELLLNFVAHLTGRSDMAYRGTERYPRETIHMFSSEMVLPSGKRQRVKITEYVF